MIDEARRHSVRGPMRRTIAFAALLVALLLAAGCGGSDESEANDLTVWAGQLCTVFSGWAEEVTTTTDALRGGDISKDSLQGAADGVKSATDTLVNDLKDTPRPDSDAGQQAKDSVDQLADELEQEAGKIESAVEDASGASGIVTAVSTVTAALATMRTQVTSTVDELEGLDAQGELRTAFEDAVPCRELSGFSAG
jgi:hypothetical protein